MSSFGTQLLDVAIGLLFVYVIMSLIASAIVEVLETFLRTRAKYLWQGLGELLSDPATRVPFAGGAPIVPDMSGEQDDDSNGDPASMDPEGKRSGRAPRPFRRARGWREAAAVPDVPPPISVETLYQHPIIGGLFYGTYGDACRRLMRRRLPTYIPRESFSTAVIDIVSRQHRLARKKPSSKEEKNLSSMETLRRGIASLPDSALKRALESISRLAGDDVALLQRRLEAWYDTAMDSVSGWYKSHAQLMLLIVGFALAAAGNIDSWRMAKDLVDDEPKRQALVESASQFVASHKDGPAPTSQQLKDYFGVIQGSALPSRDGIDRYSVLGWLVTAFAVSLGAPFWFDLLNKFVVVRSAVKPKERSQDEGPEDRPASTRGSAARVFIQ